VAGRKKNLSYYSLLTGCFNEKPAYAAAQHVNINFLSSSQAKKMKTKIFINDIAFKNF